MPTAGARFVEARNSEDRQRSAILFQLIILKKISGVAGADHFVLLTGACPLFGTFSAEDDIAKVTIFAGMQILKGCNGHFRQLINLCYFKKIRKLLAIEDRQLPARDLWKYTIVRSGNVQLLFSMNIFQSMILKRSCGAAGADHFVLITTACPRIGINDAEGTIIKVTIIGDRRSPTAGARFV